jgi:hypothetical protein
MKRCQEREERAKARVEEIFPARVSDCSELCPLGKMLLVKEEL